MVTLGQLPALLRARNEVKAKLAELNTRAERGDYDEPKWKLLHADLVDLDLDINRAAGLEAAEEATARHALEHGTVDIRAGVMPGMPGYAYGSGGHEMSTAAPSHPLQGRRSGWSVVSEPPVYQDPRHVPDGPSFFKDLVRARRGDFAAIERLHRNHQAAGLQTRDGGDMSTDAGAGGSFAPPDWLVADFIAKARPGRVTADLIGSEQLPSGVSSINLPRVAGGTTVAVQATQNSLLSDTAMTTDSVSSGIVTIGGKQIVSLQLLEQSAILFDQVVLGDLAKAYATQLGTQVLSGTGESGQLRGLDAVGVTITWTTSTPLVVSTTAAQSFAVQIGKAKDAISAAVFAPAEAIVMHPRRWTWVLNALDGESRPLVVPTSNFNSPGVAGDVASQGRAGQFMGLDVYLDPNVPLTNTTTTGQDRVYVLRHSELSLWEAPLRMEAFDATYADQASMLFRALSYSAFIPDRYAGVVQIITGTGLVAP